MLEILVWSPDDVVCCRFPEQAALFYIALVNSAGLDCVPTPLVVCLWTRYFTHIAPAYLAVQWVANYLALAGEGKAGPAWKPAVTEVHAAIQSEINNIYTYNNNNAS